MTFNLDLNILIPFFLESDNELGLLLVRVVGNARVLIYNFGIRWPYIVGNFLVLFFVEVVLDEIHSLFVNFLGFILLKLLQDVEAAIVLELVRELLL